MYIYTYAEMPREEEVQVTAVIEMVGGGGGGGGGWEGGRGERLGRFNFQLSTTQRNKTHFRQ